MSKINDSKIKVKTWIASALLVCVSVYWLAKTFINAKEDIALSDIYFVCTFVVLVLLLEIACLFLCRSFLHITFTAIGLLNTYLLHMVFASGIGSMSFWAQAAVGIAVACLYFVVLDATLRAGRMQRWLVISAALVPALFLSAEAIATLGTEQKEVSNKRLLANVKSVRLVRKPNIYFLSFDAMAPESLARKYLEMESPPYVGVLRKHGAHIIPNMFSDVVPTKYALANILKMAPDNVWDLDDVVTGNVPTPLRHILSENGYTTHFTFEGSFFGRHKGPYLDNYNYYTSYSACDFLEGDARRYGFFGFCAVREGLTSLGFFVRPKGFDFAEYSYDLLKAVARGKKTTPQFYMQHTLYPGHTKLLYSGSPEDRAEFQKSFRERAKIAAEIMDRMLSEIRVSDPTAIIFVYGDHGAWVSRQVSFSQNGEFFVQDRHGVLGAIINGNACLPYLAPPEGEHFQTTARTVTNLIKCLAGGVSPLSNDVDYGFGRQIKEEMRFENYVYEQ